MATVVWKGSVRAAAQVTTWTLGGTWESSDVINVVIGSKTVSTTAGSTTISTIVTSLAATLNAVTDAEFSTITWSANSSVLTGTADTAGIPFTCTISTTETGGGGADAQTIDGGTSSTGVDTTTCTGPNFLNVAGNWVGGSLPVDGDTVIFADSSVDVLYGMDMSSVTPAAIYFESTYTGKIGLPAYNTTNGTAGYYEYRERYLKFCAAADATNTAVYVGQGDGSGSGRIQFNAGTGQVTITVQRTAGSVDVNQPAFKFKGTHASNSVSIMRGSVGIGAEAGDTATAATLKVGYITNPNGDADVICGTGVTLATVEVSGGSLITRSAITTLNQTGGEVIHLAGAVTTANVDGGKLIYRSSGTATTVRIGGGGIVDCAQDMQARTFTNFEMHAGSEFYDPHGTVTATNGVDFYRCSPSETVFKVVPHRTWTPSSI